MKVLILAACVVVVSTTSAATRGNPYKSIVARNVFQLQPLVMAPEAKPQPIRRVPAAIFITGLVGVGGVAKAFVEINEPGKPVHRHIVHAGSGLDFLEVLDVDVEGGAVRIRRDGAEETFTLQSPKPPAPRPPVPPAMPPMPPMPPRTISAWRG